MSRALTPTTIRAEIVRHQEISAQGSSLVCRSSLSTQKHVLIIQQGQSSSGRELQLSAHHEPPGTSSRTNHLHEDIIPIPIVRARNLLDMPNDIFANIFRYLSLTQIRNLCEDIRFARLAVFHIKNPKLLEKHFDEDVALSVHSLAISDHILKSPLGSFDKLCFEMLSRRFELSKTLGEITEETQMPTLPAISLAQRQYARSIVVHFLNAATKANDRAMKAEMKEFVRRFLDAESFDGFLEFNKTLLGAMQMQSRSNLARVFKNMNEGLGFLIAKIISKQNEEEFDKILDPAMLKYLSSGLVDPEAGLCVDVMSRLNMLESNGDIPLPDVEKHKRMMLDRAMERRNTLVPMTLLRELFLGDYANIHQSLIDSIGHSAKAPINIYNHSFFVRDLVNEIEIELGDHFGRFLSRLLRNAVTNKNLLIFDSLAPHYVNFIDDYLEGNDEWLELEKQPAFNGFVEAVRRSLLPEP